MLIMQKRSKAGPSSATSRSIAQRGVSGAATRTPWSGELERGFGPKLRTVEFHVDQQAHEACEELGVRAYALGPRVATRDSAPSLEVAAHETFHALGAREDGTPQSERAARAAERNVERGQRVELPAASGSSARAPLSFYSEYHWGLDDFDKTHKWTYTLEANGKGVRMSDKGDIAVEQSSQGGSTEEQKRVYATDTLANNTNAMFTEISSPYRLIPDGSGKVPNPDNLEDVNRTLPRWMLERESNEDGSCGGSGNDMKTLSDCREHAWDVLNIGDDRAIEVHAPKLDAYGLNPTPEVHPTLQMAYMMLAVGTYLEAERAQTTEKLSPERLERRAALEKTYKTYQRKAWIGIENYFAIRCIQDAQDNNGMVPPGFLAAKCRQPGVEYKINDYLAQEQLRTPEHLRIADRKKAVDYVVFLAGEMARKPYDALSNSEKRAVAQEIGFNEWAAPEMGDALAIVQGGMEGVDEKTHMWKARNARGLDSDASHDPSRFHYAAVIMKSGTDYLTFENVSGSPATAWYLQLYGHGNKPGEDSFHATWKSVHGNRPTTMVLRPFEVP